MTSRLLVALLRAINVGRARRVPMAEVREALDGVGEGPVRTHLQSGNVVLLAAAPAIVAEEIRTRIADRFGLDVPVLMRTANRDRAGRWPTATNA